MKLETAASTTDFPVVDASSFDEPPAGEFRTLLAKGITAARNGERAKARELLTHATDLNPQSENAWMWLASLSEYPEELLAILESVLKINPVNERAVEWQTATLKVLANVFVGRGVKAHAEGATQLALQLFDQALEYDERCELAWFWKSSVTASEEDRIECLRRVLEINPENDDARKTLDSLTRPVEQPDVVAQSGEIESNEIYDYETSSTALVTGELDADELETLDDMSDLAKAYAADDEAGVDEESAGGESAFVFSDEWKADGSEHPSESSTVVASDRGVSEAMVDENAAESERSLAGVSCPFCDEQNSPQALECCTCHATLSISNIEAVFDHPSADRELIQQAVTQMEAEWNLREFSQSELTTLALGHFNLNNFSAGVKYLTEASRLDTNNVILAGQVNAISIRIEELRRQEENHGTMPKAKTILIVDDSLTVRKLIAGKLEKSGHFVRCAGDGVEGLASIDEKLPDLVLLDITMPRMDGYDMCKKIRSNPQAKELPVVMISGKDGFFDKARGRMAGCTGYITKPFGPETLMKALEVYLTNENESSE
jgi:twitching motility two-component system response regulator PilG